MEVLGVGPGELILILIIALIVFGPERLPEIGAALGKTLRQFQVMSRGVMTEFDREVQATREVLEQPQEAEQTEDEMASDGDGA